MATAFKLRHLVIQSRQPGHRKHQVQGRAHHRPPTKSNSSREHKGHWALYNKYTFNLMANDCTTLPVDPHNADHRAAVQGQERHIVPSAPANVAKTARQEKNLQNRVPYRKTLSRMPLHMVPWQQVCPCSSNSQPCRLHPLLSRPGHPLDTPVGYQPGSDAEPPGKGSHH